MDVEALLVFVSFDVHNSVFSRPVKMTLSQLSSESAFPYALRNNKCRFAHVVQSN